MTRRRRSRRHLLVGRRSPAHPARAFLPADGQDPIAALAVMRSVLGGNLEHTGTLPAFPLEQPPNRLITDEGVAVGGAS